VRPLWLPSPLRPYDAIVDKQLPLRVNQ
jgi:hypothetical protein